MIDPLLESLLLATSDEDIDEIISELISMHAAPVIKRVIVYKLHLNPHHGTEQADVDDIQQEVLLQLLMRLRQFRQRSDDYPISDVRGLTATITRSACARWMQRRFPERHAFKNRLYYLLTHQPGLALWLSENRKQMAGFKVWQGRKDIATVEQFDRLSEEEALLDRIRSFKSGKEADWGSVLAAVFDCLGGPVEFDKLTGFLAGLLRIEDRPVISLDPTDESGQPDPPAEQPDLAWQTEKKIFLERAWEEICELPAKQRVALLLNLQREYHRLFLIRGIATYSQIAEALEINPEKLPEMWSELPLEDAKIAELLQLTRQQVINARKSARKRLTRRLRGFI
jgi:DNA-directed RNA polymerase specialized sigma24 family protein